MVTKYNSLFTHDSYFYSKSGNPVYQLNIKPNIIIVDIALKTNDIITVINIYINIYFSMKKLYSC